jgi:hypothetical protein
VKLTYRDTYKILIGLYRNKLRWTGRAIFTSANILIDVTMIGWLNGRQTVWALRRPIDALLHRLRAHPEPSRALPVLLDAVKQPLSKKCRRAHDTVQDAFLRPAPSQTHTVHFTLANDLVEHNECYL